MAGAYPATGSGPWRVDASMRTLAAATLLSLAVSVPALAATPESGSVSKASPAVTWEGTAPGYGVFPTNLLLTTLGEDPAPCEPPYCDTFALTVADKADLNLQAAQSGADNFTELHVIKPDGEMIFAQSADSEPVRVKVKAAEPGEYTIEVMTNETVASGGAYGASATLAVAAAPAPSGGTPPSSDPPPPPSTVSPPPAGQDDGPKAAASLALVTKTVKAAKKLRLAVSSSGPVTDFKLVVKKGRKIVARGALARLAGKAHVTLKVKRRLKKGTYGVAMTAKDGNRQVGLTTKLRVRK